MVELTEVYLCARCFSAGSAAGPCPRCGLERVHCSIGGLEDPARRPLIDAAGRVLCRAPLWWLEHTTPHLRRLMSPRPPARI